MSRFRVEVEMNSCDQDVSHKVNELIYESELGNSHGICKRCGKILRFYIGSHDKALFTFVINPGIYLLQDTYGYQKISIEPCLARSKQKIKLD